MTMDEAAIAHMASQLGHHTCNGCQLWTVGGDVNIAHLCDGCHIDNPDTRYLVMPHPVWGHWHADFCMPPSDWPGP